jgi:cytidylate kinase
VSGKRGLIIAIDGPAGSGKSTTAKLVAKRLGYMHIDTGAMYLAVALKFLRLGVELADEERVTDVLHSTTVSQAEQGSATQILLDGHDVSEAIRTPEISMWVGPVSENAVVREHLVEWQRKLGEAGGVVLEGRDIGTVVFPRADLKVYMVAEIETRAKRRRKEMLARGIDQPLAEVQTALATRDERDSNREHSPLRKAADALELDTSDLSIGDQIERVIALAKKIQPSLVVHLP